jgi:DNA mismatch repair protein MutL
MEKEDALLSVAHHTTSKLKTESDLLSLCTYGFRGEALSSIASVSHFTIKTKTEQQVEGYEIQLSGQQITSQTIIAHPVGTTIDIRDLFFNTPARQKFLKKESTELNQIKQLFFANCFAALAVHFSLTSNQRSIYSCPSVKTLLDRIIQLEGIEASKHMLELQEQKGERFTISGIVSDTQYVSYDRSDIFIFVNNRWIKNTTLIRALIQGYQNSLPAQKFPRAVLKIDIEQSEIDINIHPKKEEVRFLHPRRIEMAITQAVKQTLESVLPKPAASQIYHAPFSAPSFFYQQEQQSVTQSKILTAQPSIKAIDIPKQIPKQVEPKEQQTVLQQTVVMKDELYCIGQLFQTYIVASSNNTFYLIDQHAAHERILFEKTVSKNQGLLSITQAFPIMVSLVAESVKNITPYQSIFAACGIIFEPFDTTTIIISATPASFSPHDFTQLFEEMSAMLKTEKDIDKNLIESRILHNIRCSIACKSAVKAGDHLDMLFMMQLLTELSSTHNRFCCPHGRPTMWELSQYEIEKKFKRK